MSITVTPTEAACGASVQGVDLTQQLSEAEIASIRAAWLEHHVLIFPNQPMNDDDLERFSLYFGEFGVDPFIKPLEGRKNIIAIQREADETSPIFADIWHTDWSFQKIPPAGTCLLGIDIPPEGGDTLFANQHLALEKMPAELRERLEGKKAIHSAVAGYSKKGSYGEKDTNRSMVIEASDEALDQESHLIIREHPESGKEMVFGTAMAYIIGIEGMPQAEAMKLLLELQHWQTREEFVYRHKWEKDMLVMWDNRSVLHKATGGFEGYRRELHRTTVADNSVESVSEGVSSTAQEKDIKSSDSSGLVVTESEMSLEEIVASLQPAVDKFGGFPKPVKLNIEPAGYIFIHGHDVIADGAESKASDCTVTMQMQDYIDIVNGKSDLMSLHMAGKFEIEGDSSVAISLVGLF